MKTFRVQVTQEVEVTIDETKFDEEFMEQFSNSIFHTSSLDDHINHLAWAFGTGVVTDSAYEFIEGYGPVTDFGIEFKQNYVETEIL